MSTRAWPRGVVGIDPGPTESALCLFDGERPGMANTLPNEELLLALPALCMLGSPLLVIEKVESFGMAVGAEVFETVFWSGRVAQVWEAAGGEWERLGRMAVKMHLCHDSRAKDPNIRRALMDRFGPPGTKKARGLTYGMSGHTWAALAVAVTAWDVRGTAGERECRRPKSFSPTVQEPVPLAANV